MTHQDVFNTILDLLNNQNIMYVFVRGFMLLPKTPDSDLDIVVKESDYKKVVTILEKYCNERKNIGITYKVGNKDLIYQSYRTIGDYDHKINNGSFQFDIYNYSFNFEGNVFYLVNDAFHEYLFDNRIVRDNYYIPSPGAEIILLFFRGYYDHNCRWQAKHINRIRELYNNKESIEELSNLLKLLDSSTNSNIKQFLEKQIR